jgi:predicted nucleic acid-binding protein
MDLLIGVTASLKGLPLLTRDRHHFDRISNLLVETY